MSPHLISKRCVDETSRTSVYREVDIPRDSMDIKAAHSHQGNPRKSQTSAAQPVVGGTAGCATSRLSLSGKPSGLSPSLDLRQNGCCLTGSTQERWEGLEAGQIGEEEGGGHRPTDRPTSGFGGVGEAGFGGVAVAFFASLGSLPLQSQRGKGSGGTIDIAPPEPPHPHSGREA
jgi:hypothetical protein